MNIITDTKQINLTSGTTEAKKNGILNSNLSFNIPNLMNKNKNVIYNTIKISHAEIPYSFYIINEYNNILNLSSGQISLTLGNYNANTFLRLLKTLLPITYTVSFDTFTGKFTLEYNTSFSILANSTCYKLMGFEKDIVYLSSNNKIVMPYPANFLGTKNIYVKCPNIILDNYNTKTKDYITLLSIPVNVPPYGIILYENTSNMKNVIKNNHLDRLEVLIYDDDDNLIDFNNIDWSITIEIETFINMYINNLNIGQYLENQNQNNLGQISSNENNEN
jgi:hypothetical protein